jgi:hypothetical protein
VYHEDSPSQANFCLSKQTLQVMMWLNLLLGRVAIVHWHTKI